MVGGVYAPPLTMHCLWPILATYSSKVTAASSTSSASRGQATHEVQKPLLLFRLLKLLISPLLPLASSQAAAMSSAHRTWLGQFLSWLMVMPATSSNSASHCAAEKVRAG